MSIRTILDQIKLGSIALPEFQPGYVWKLSDRTDLFDAGGNIREGAARERDAPAGFPPMCSQRSSSSRT